MGAGDPIRYADIFNSSGSTMSTINFSKLFKLFDKRHLGHGKEE
jgi:hypothetical protein